MALSQNAKKLLDLIPKDGKTIGNTSLQRKSGFSDNEYWTIRQEIIDEGQIETARGLGGSVKFITPQQKYSKEVNLYSDFEKYIKVTYIQSYGIDSNFVIENTSSQGRKNTGGAWTRPDFAIAHIRSFEYFPSKTLEVTTFEIKKNIHDSVIGVYEAISHRSFANKSYLVSLLKDGDRDLEFFQRISNECTRNNVGWLISYDGIEYTEEVEAEYHSADFVTVENFINKQFSEQSKQILRKSR